MTKTQQLTIEPTNEVKSSIAMTLTLMSFSMLFAAFLLGYAVFRFNSLQWPPMGLDRVDLFLPTVSTVVILVSSLFYAIFERKVFQNIWNIKFLWATTFMGLVFMGVQTYFWDSLKNAGFLAGSGIFQSLVYGFTWTHAGHIVLALVLLFWLALKLNSYKKDSKEKALLWVKNVGKFWHFLGVVWLVIYLTVFIL